MRTRKKQATEETFQSLKINKSANKLVYFSPMHLFIKHCPCCGSYFEPYSEKGSVTCGCHEQEQEDNETEKRLKDFMDLNPTKENWLEENTEKE